MKVWLSHGVINEMLRMGREFSPLEVGGVLLGWRNGDERTVVGLIGPGPAAMHGRQAFIPDHRWQVEQICKAFETTGGDLDYLGEWHTHPIGPARMSAADESTLRRIGRRVSDPVMIIVDPTRRIDGIAGWSLRRSGWFASAIESVTLTPFTPNPRWPTVFVR